MEDPKPDASFTFWQRWLFSVAILIVLFGLSLAFFNQSAAFDMLFNNQINPVFWNDRMAPENVIAFQRWIYSVLGATVAVGGCSWLSWLITPSSPNNVGLGFASCWA
jgi:hypothetical protein